MAYGASTYGYLWQADLETALARLGQMGFAYTEILAAAPHLSPGVDPDQAPELVQAIRRSGVPVVSVNPPGQDINLASADEIVRDYSLRVYRGALRWAAAVGAPWVVVVPGKRHPLLPAPWDRAVATARGSLESLLQEARRLDVRLAVENIPGRFLETAADLMEFLAPFPADWVQVAMDVANAHMVEDPAAALRAVLPRLGLVHLSDTTRGRWAHAAIGSGDVSFGPVLEVLAAQAPDTPVILEIIDASAETALLSSRTALRDLEAMQP